VIVIDSNVWIFSESANSEEHDIAVKKVKEIFDSDTFGINVVITSEVYHILGKFLGVKESRSRVTDILEHPLAQWLPFSDQIALDAVKLAYSSQMRINDALIAQQALKVGAPVLTDNVKDFEKVKNLEVLLLR
jgi:predicted nucleic acid-binding protein